MVDHYLVCKDHQLTTVKLSVEVTCDGQVNHLSFVLLKGNQKLAYLKRRIPDETKLSVKCNLVKTYIISILFYESNVWYNSKTIVRQMERFQRKGLKLIPSNSHFTDKEYKDCLRSVNLLPITYQFVFFFCIS